MSSYLGKTQYSRGIRNNNPGNLVYSSATWLGKIPFQKNTDQNKKFEQFETVFYGLRAMLRNLVVHIDRGENTLRKLITTYAPPVENDTEKYIQDMAKALNIKSDTIISSVDSDFLFLLAKAIIKKENGKDGNLITDSEIKQAVYNMGTVKTSKITVNNKKKINFLIVIPLLLFCYTVFVITV